MQGFNITLNEACRAEQYRHLTDLGGLFAQEKDIEANGGAKPADLDEKCSFKVQEDNSTYAAIFGFKTCGKSPITVTDTHSIFSTYVNHEIKVDDIVTSQMDQNHLQCVLE